MNSLNSYFKNHKGIFYSFFDVIPYSILPLIFLVNFHGPDTLSYNFAQGAVLTVGKDLISSIVFVITILLTRRGKETLAILKSKAGLFAAVAAIAGGPLGYTFYNTAFYMAGPSFGHVFTSLEPILLALFAYLFLKRKFKWQMWMGVGLTVISTIAMVAGESTQAGDTYKILIGSALGLLGSISWTIESVLFDRAITMAGDESLMPLLTIKMAAGMIFNFAVMFPVTGGIVGDAGHSYKLFATFFTVWDHAWRLIVAGLLIVLGRVLFFSALKYQGATFVNVIYSLTIIVLPAFNLIYYWMTGDFVGGDITNQLTMRFQLVFWICVTGIITGTTLATLYSVKIDRDQERIDNDKKRTKRISKLNKR